MITSIFACFLIFIFQFTFRIIFLFIFNYLCIFAFNMYSITFPFPSLNDSLDLNFISVPAIVATRVVVNLVAGRNGLGFVGNSATTVFRAFFSSCFVIHHFRFVWRRAVTLMIVSRHFNCLDQCRSNSNKDKCGDSERQTHTPNIIPIE